MKKRVLCMLVVSCLIWVGLAPVTALAADNTVSSLSLNGGTLAWSYTTSDATIVRFDFNFHASDSSSAPPADLLNPIAWANADTGNSASNTSPGVTISHEGDTFHISADLKQLRLHPSSGSFSLDRLAPPNTHLWLEIRPCNEGNVVESYVSLRYLGNFSQWSEVLGGNFQVGNDYYPTLAQALEHAASGQTVEMLANPAQPVTGTLKDGVTLKGTAGSTYTSQGGDAQIAVDAGGSLTVMNTGSGKLHCSSGSTSAVMAGGLSKTVSSSSTQGYDIVAPTAGAPYITGIPGGDYLDMDNVKFYAGSTSEKIFLPDPFFGSEAGHVEAAIGAGQAGSVMLDSGYVLTTDGANTREIRITMDGIDTIVQLPAGNKFTLGGKEYSNPGPADLYIHTGLEVYKALKAAEISGKHSPGESAAVKGLIDAAQQAVSDYIYDKDRLFVENQQNIDAILTKLEQDIAAQQLRENKEAFAQYRDSKADEANGKHAAGESGALKKLIDDAKAAIAGLPYDEGKSLAENKQAIDNILARLSQDIAAQQLDENKEAFAQYRDSKADEAGGKHAAGESDAVKKLIDDAKAAIAGLPYDEGKSLAENKRAIDDILARLSQDIAAQQLREKEGAAAQNTPSNANGAAAPAEAGAPKTGDSRPLVFWAVLMVLAAAGLFSAIFVRVRARRHSKK